MRRLRLSLRRARERMEVRRSLALGDHLRDHDINGAAVLCMNQAQPVELSRLLHHAEHQLVIDHQHIRIGHEELEAGDAELHHLFHLRQRLRAAFAVQVRHRHVQGEIHAGLLVRLLQPDIERLFQRAPLVLQGKVDHRRGSAHSRSLRSGRVIVRRGCSTERHIQMRMNVNSTRHHQQARRVHNLMPFRIDAVAYTRNHLAGDQHILLLRSRRAHHRPVLNQNSHKQTPTGNWLTGKLAAESRQLAVTLASAHAKDSGSRSLQPLPIPYPLPRAPPSSQTAAQSRAAPS